MQTLITALGGFLRKHKASVVCERPDALRRYVAANELEFYAVSTFLRRTETVRSIDDVEALTAGGVTATAGGASAMTPGRRGGAGAIPLILRPRHRPRRAQGKTAARPLCHPVGQAAPDAELCGELLRGARRLYARGPAD